MTDILSSPLLGKEGRRKIREVWDAGGPRHPNDIICNCTGITWDHSNHDCADFAEIMKLGNHSEIHGKKPKKQTKKTYQKYNVDSPVEGSRLPIT